MSFDLTTFLPASILEVPANPAEETFAKKVATYSKDFREEVDEANAEDMPVEDSEYFLQARGLFVEASSGNYSTKLQLEAFAFMEAVCNEFEVDVEDFIFNDFFDNGNDEEFADDLNGSVESFAALWKEAPANLLIDLFGWALTKGKFKMATRMLVATNGVLAAKRSYTFKCKWMDFVQPLQYICTHIEAPEEDDDEYEGDSYEDYLYFIFTLFYLDQRDFFWYEEGDSKPKRMLRHSWFYTPFSRELSYLPLRIEELQEKGFAIGALTPQMMAWYALRERPHRERTGHRNHFKTDWEIAETVHEGVEKLRIMYELEQKAYKTGILSPVDYGNPNSSLNNRCSPLINYAIKYKNDFVLRMLVDMAPDDFFADLSKLVGFEKRVEHTQLTSVATAIVGLLRTNSMAEVRDLLKTSPSETDSSSSAAKRIKRKASEVEDADTDGEDEEDAADDDEDMAAPSANKRART